MVANKYITLFDSSSLCVIAAIYLIPSSALVTSGHRDRLILDKFIIIIIIKLL